MHEGPPSTDKLIGDAWSHEIKYDGYRTQIHLVGGHAIAFTRNASVLAAVRALIKRDAIHP